MSQTLTNTQGKITFDYRVEILVDGSLTVATLCVKLPNQENYTYYDNANGIDSDFAIALNKALKRGSKKWGIELMTLKRKIA